MPTPLKEGNLLVGATDVTVAKVRFYDALHQLNENFERVLDQLRRLGTGGVRRLVAKRLEVIVEETRAEINFELVELLHERELSDWTHFGRLRQKGDKEVKDRKQTQPKRRARVRRRQ